MGRRKVAYRFGILGSGDIQTLNRRWSLLCWASLVWKGVVEHGALQSQEDGAIKPFLVLQCCYEPHGRLDCRIKAVFTEFGLAGL